MPEKLKGIDNNLFILTSIGWVKIDKVTVDTKFLTMVENEGVRKFSYRFVKSLQTVDFDGLIRYFDFKDGYCTSSSCNLKGYNSFQPSSILEDFIIKSSELVKFKGKLTNFKFSESCFIFLLKKSNHPYFTLKID